MLSGIRDEPQLRRKIRSVYPSCYPNTFGTSWTNADVVLDVKISMISYGARQWQRKKSNTGCAKVFPSRHRKMFVNRITSSLRRQCTPVSGNSGLVQSVSLVLRSSQGKTLSFCHIYSTNLSTASLRCKETSKINFLSLAPL